MRPPTTSNAIYEDLKKKIANGELRSGDYLIESRLTQIYGASRTPVRQALHLLQEDGLVTNIPRKGTYVTFLNTEDVIEAYQAAEALESMAVFLFASRKDRDISVLKPLNQRMQEALGRHDIAAWCLLDEKFHEQIFIACGNTILLRFHNNLKNNMRRVRAIYSSIWHDKQLSCKEHEAILECINQGDARNARILIQNHYRSVINQAVLTLGLETGQQSQPIIPLDGLLPFPDGGDKDPAASSGVSNLNHRERRGI